jgi:DNA polymerase III alpha subunit (gram-positive type)
MASYLFLDLETTSLGDNAGVIEIAAIPYIDGVEHPHFHSIIRPHDGATLDPKAFEVTGINVNDIWSFPDAKGVLNEFIKWVDLHETKFSLAGHNVAFDRGKLFTFFCRNGEYSSFITRFRNRDIDTLKLARKIYKGKKDKPSSFTLEKLCSYHGIQATVYHRALGDIQNTIKLFHELENLLPKIEVINEKLSYHEKLRKFMDMKYIQMNPDGDVFITKEAMGHYDVMAFILNELYELACDPIQQHLEMA